MKIVSVVGARPNFIKIAPLMKEMKSHDEITPVLVHTGQHYDFNMAQRFFEDLRIPAPDVSLEIGSGSHAYQTAEVMKRLEPVLEAQKPDLVLVVGDVNSTMAAALTAVKLHIPVAHVEAGLRSFDRSMPEEINRLVTDAVSDYLFVTEESGNKNLLAEGIDQQKVFLVGNVMIDCLESSRKMWESSKIHARLGLCRGRYGVVTLHRPSSVDSSDTLRGLVMALGDVAGELPVVFPLHPRTRTRLETLGLMGTLVTAGDGAPRAGSIYGVDPLGYLDFMCLVAHARIVITDSGGLQEETTVLGVPCLTLRENTERPITVTHGTNRVVGSSPARIAEEAARVLEEPRPSPCPPPLWDGKASQRIVAILQERLNCRVSGEVVTTRSTAAMLGPVSAPAGFSGGGES